MFIFGEMQRFLTEDNRIGLLIGPLFQFVKQEQIKSYVIQAGDLSFWTQLCLMDLHTPNLILIYKCLFRQMQNDLASGSQLLALFSHLLKKSALDHNFTQMIVKTVIKTAVWLFNYDKRASVNSKNMQKSKILQLNHLSYFKLVIQSRLVNNQISPILISYNAKYQSAESGPSEHNSFQKLTNFFIVQGGEPRDSESFKLPRIHSQRDSSQSSSIKGNRVTSGLVLRKQLEFIEKKQEMSQHLLQQK